MTAQRPRLLTRDVQRGASVSPAARLLATTARLGYSSRPRCSIDSRALLPHRRIVRAQWAGLAPGGGG